MDIVCRRQCTVSTSQSDNPRSECATEAHRQCFSIVARELWAAYHRCDRDCLAGRSDGARLSSFSQLRTNQPNRANTQFGMHTGPDMQTVTERLRQSLRQVYNSNCTTATTVAEAASGSHQLISAFLSSLSFLIILH